MSFFVYRSQSSTGARELADALGGARLRGFLNGRFYRRRDPGADRVGVNVRANDVVVMWGSHVAGVPQGVKILNNVPIRGKFEEATALRTANVPTIEVSRNRPADEVGPAPSDPAVTAHRAAVELLEDFVDTPIARNDVYIRGLNDVTTRLQVLQDAIRRPAPVGQRRPAGNWVGRTNDHTGGTDLLTPPTQPDYFVKKLELTNEYRVHVFEGLSIRAGKKVHREGFRNPNAWIRSYEAGWKIDYNDFKSTKAMREIAVNAVKALGLNFGAVDIGEKADGTLVVLEVNRAPGLEGGTVNSYQGAIEKWAAGTWVRREAAPRARRRAA